jgi:hypothetical protein
MSRYHDLGYSDVRIGGDGVPMQRAGRDPASAGPQYLRSVADHVRLAGQ